MTARGDERLLESGAATIELISFVYAEREVPLKVYLPESKKPAPVILFSHGLGGSREAGTYLGELWASKGFVVVAMQHLGSDESVWKEERLSRHRSKRNAAAAAATNGETFQDRMRDVPATLDQLEKWQVDGEHFLQGRMNLAKIGLGGHSYGANTTQALVGQSFAPLGRLYHDERIDAALLLSPSPPRVGTAEKAFSQISLPMMLMTGTKDGSLIRKMTPEQRREVFSALPKGDKFELVLRDAEHHAFADAGQRGQQRNSNHHRVIQALSTAFWEVYLTDNKKARDWLNSGEPEKLMQEGDLWSKK